MGVKMGRGRGYDGREGLHPDSRATSEGLQPLAWDTTPLQGLPKDNEINLFFSDCVNLVPQNTPFLF